MKKARIETEKGTIVLELFEDDAPSTVANFVGLATGNKEWTDPKTGEKVKKPLYDGLRFHRVIDNFMIQGGDPLTRYEDMRAQWGQGGPGLHRLRPSARRN
jgi:peptidyl-prolyl cis-trans isomerase A (cyclophilin A)